MLKVTRPLQNLIRLHPATGGRDIAHGSQFFQGVSTDLFFGMYLDHFSDSFYITHITRKLNISIAINPEHWSAEDFLRHFTVGQLKDTSKCKLHGDKQSGLKAHANLMQLLTKTDFTMDGVSYSYDSIGVACNSSYEPVSQRQGNDFEGKSSHFEIKFLRKHQESPNEYLCINIHLMKEPVKPFGKDAAIERLTQAINLFYAELGLSSHSAMYRHQTNLQSTMSVTLDNFEASGFSCKHPTSQAVLEQYKTLKEKRLPLCNDNHVAAPVKIKKRPTTMFSSASYATDFPPLSQCQPK